MSDLTGSCDSGNGHAPRRQTLATGLRQTGLLVLLILVIGIAIGRTLPGAHSAIAADPAADATATRQAELQELNDLRTKVAQPVVCTPPATETPTLVPTPEPTATLVPVQPAGIEVVDSTGWGVTVLSIQPVPVPAGVEVSGQLMRVSIELSNTTNEPMLPPFVDWRLVDSAGKRYPVSITATSAIAGAAWGVAVGPNHAEERTVVFEVAPGAGTSFVLENEKDPEFRIEVAIESRG